MELDINSPVFITFVDAVLYIHYVGSSSSHQSTCSGSSWILWRESGISTRHNRGRICSILLGIAVFFVVVSVLAIAGLAVYMGALRIDTTKVNLLFDGGLRVTSGDSYTNDLVDNSSIAFREKAYKYQSLISNIYQRSVLSPAFKQCIVSNFENGSLVVFFRLTLDRRKIPNTIMGNIEDSTKEILLDEVASNQKTFQNISIDISSVFIRRHSEENSVHTSSFHTLDHFHNLLDNRTLEIRNGVILKSSTLNSSYKNTGSKSTTKNENSTNKEITTKPSASSEDSKSASKSAVEDFINNEQNNSSVKEIVVKELKLSNYSEKNSSDLDSQTSSTSIEDTKQNILRYSQNGSVMDFNVASNENENLDKNLKVTLHNSYTTQETIITLASEREKAESPRTTKSENDSYYNIEEYMTKSSEERVNENRPVKYSTESRNSHYGFLPQTPVVDEPSQIGTKVLIPLDMSLINSTDTLFNPEILNHNTYNHRYNHYNTFTHTNTANNMNYENYSPYDITQHQTSSLNFNYHKENVNNPDFSKKSENVSDTQSPYYNPKYEEAWKPIVPSDGDVLHINSDKFHGVAEIVVVPPSSIDIRENDQNLSTAEYKTLISSPPQEISVLPHAINKNNNVVSYVSSENNKHVSPSSVKNKDLSQERERNKNSSVFEEQPIVSNNMERENTFINESSNKDSLNISFNVSEIFHKQNDILEQNSKNVYNSTNKKEESLFDFPEISLAQQFENFHTLIQKLNNTYENNKAFSKQEYQMIKLNETNNDTFQDPVKILTHISSSIHNDSSDITYDYDISTMKIPSDNKEIMINENMTPSTVNSNPSMLTDHLLQKSTLFAVVTERSEEKETKDHLSTFPPISSLEIIEIYDDDEVIKGTHTTHKINLGHAEVIDAEVIDAEQKDKLKLPLVTLLPVRSNLGVFHPLRPRPKTTTTTVASNTLSQNTISILLPQEKEIDEKDETLSISEDVTHKVDNDVPNIYSIFEVGERDSSKEKINDFSDKLKENINDSKNLHLSLEKHLFPGSFNLTGVNEDVLFHVKNSDMEKSKNMSDKLTKIVVSENHNPILQKMQDKIVKDEDKYEEHSENKTINKLQTQTLHTKAILELLTHSKQQTKHLNTELSLEEVSQKTNVNLSLSETSTAMYVSTIIYPDTVNITEQSINLSKGDISPINTTLSLIDEPSKEIMVVSTERVVSRNTELSYLIDFNKENIKNTTELSDFPEESVYIKLPDVKEIYRPQEKVTSQSKSESKFNFEDMTTSINHGHTHKPEKALNHSARQSKMNFESTFLKDLNPRHDVITTQATENFEDIIEDVINGVTNPENLRNSLNFLDNYLKQKHFTKRTKNNTHILNISQDTDASTVTDSVTKPYSYDNRNNVSDFYERENNFEENLFNSTFAHTTDSMLLGISNKMLENNHDMNISEKIVVSTNFSVSKIAVTRKNETSVEVLFQENAKPPNSTHAAVTNPKNFGTKLASYKSTELKPIFQENSENRVTYSPVSEQAMSVLKKYAVIHLSTQSKSNDDYVDNDDDGDGDDGNNNKNNSSTNDALTKNMTNSETKYEPHKNYANENKLIVNSYDENTSFSFFPAFAMLTKVYHKISTTENYAFVGVFPEDETSIDIVNKAEECPRNLSLRCGNGECISELSKCNQLVDCNDGADERDCTCADYLRAQFLTRKLCDGIVDCWDFTDENDCEWCSPGQFVCPNSEVCINQEELCDGHRDCPYGDDEKQCFTISNNRALAGEFSYHTEGFLMVRKEGKWGKLCIQNFDFVVSHSRTSWKVTDLGRAVCRAMTFSDFDQVDRMIDHAENREVDQEEYYELGYTTAESNESSARSSLSFQVTACSKKEVIHVKCKDLECGVRPKAIGQWARSRHSRIVGGGNASPGSWPWLAALYKEGNFQCGATLISDTWLISAGHCFYHSLDDYWVARLGALRRGTNFPSPYEQLHPISHIILHPGYIDAGYINDISLLRMEQPVAFSDYIRPICLPPPNVNIKDGKICTVVGWGQLFEVGRIFPDTLQEVELPIISTAECRKRTLFLPLYRVTDNMFCAGFERGGRDACLGDSGGPLMCQEKDGRWSLYGVTSNGYGCARANRPGVYTKVANYANWVDSAVKREVTTMRSVKNFCKGHRCPLGECLPQNRVCNGFMECSDGSDERGCW